MKVGTVLSTCIYDIVTGAVSESEVLLILDVIGYDFEDKTDWERCWATMTNQTLPSTSWNTLRKSEVYKTVLNLSRRQKIHNYNYSSYSHKKMFWAPWLDLTIPNRYVDDMPALRQVWEDYLVLSRLNEL